MPTHLCGRLDGSLYICLLGLQEQPVLGRHTRLQGLGHSGDFLVTPLSLLGLDLRGHVSTRAPLDELVI
jgi:hypothetical protein